MSPVPVFAGLILLVALAVIMWAVRTRPKGPKPLPPLNASLTRYEHELRQWQKDYARGKDKRPDFPSLSDWKALQVLEYHKRHGVWPGEETEGSS